MRSELSEDLKGFLEIQPRATDEKIEVDRLLIRPAIYFSTSPEWTIWAGYFAGAEFEANTNWEHRLWQQAQWDLKVDQLSYTNRFRIEERFLPDHSVVGLRLRNLFRMTAPIAESSPWSVFLGDELFWNLNSAASSALAGFDQNRALVGMRFNINPHDNVEAAYLNQFVYKHGNFQDQMNHVIQITFNWSL
jgi:hypothetical protein